MLMSIYSFFPPTFSLRFKWPEMDLVRSSEACHTRKTLSPEVNRPLNCCCWCSQLSTDVQSSPTKRTTCPWYRWIVPVILDLAHDRRQSISEVVRSARHPPPPPIQSFIFQNPVSRDGIVYIWAAVASLRLSGNDYGDKFWDSFQKATRRAIINWIDRVSVFSSFTVISV